MRHTMKVAKWEIKRNLKNKSFVIGLFLTPIIMAIFMIVPSLFSDSGPDPESIDIFVNDELNMIADLEDAVADLDYIDWHIEATDETLEDIQDELESSDNIVYIPLTETALNEGTIKMYTSEEIDANFANQTHLLEDPLRQMQLEKLGLSTEAMEIVSNGIAFDIEVAEDSSEATDEAGNETGSMDEGDLLKRLIPGAFAGVILFSIVISGMMIFQSASQEKKDKIAEIILSSLTPNELMQGKIVGYFVLGLIQVFVWIGLALPVIMWKFDLPIFEHLFTPELVVLLLFAVLGYLLFASLFVGLGATMEDVSTSGNFQGMVLMLPFIPFILIGPVISNPAGMVAKIAGYIPITSPAVMIMRLSMLEEWPWMEIAISVIILIISVWLFMKLAGKIFKTGILLYGKNATPKEIWKWLWN